MRLTKLREEEKKKKLLGEHEKKIEILGQESESKAKKYVIEEAKEADKQEQKKKDEGMNVLDNYRNQVQSYKFYLCKFLHDLIIEVRFPITYRWGVWFDGKGIRVAVVDKKGKKYKRAFRISYEPQYDINMCYQFAVWADDIYDLAEGNISQNPNIWTPKQIKIN